MFAMCGYNFFKDIDALNPAVVGIDKYIHTELTNGIFDYWNITRDVIFPYSKEIPTVWDFLTVMDCNFNGNIAAGSLDVLFSQIDGYKIKRKQSNELNWITLKYLSKEEVPDNSFIFQDNLARSNTEYEYAIVPVIGGIEGDYITNTINSKFSGVFICDLDTIYKFYAGVSYGSQERVQKVGVFEPYGRRYPVVVSNGLINYNKGSVSGTVLPNDYMQTKALDRMAMVKEREQLIDFLTNKKAKILKDTNGNIWLMIISSNPTVSFDSSYGMGIANVSANWTEIGNPNDKNDLYNCGLLKEIE